MTAKKRRPEFELGPLLIQVVQGYLGKRQVNQLTSLQASNIARLCNETSNAIGRVIEGGDQQVQLLSILPDEREDGGQ